MPKVFQKINLVELGEICVVFFLTAPGICGRNTANNNQTIVPDVAGTGGGSRKSQAEELES